MANYISKVKLPNNEEYLIKDSAAWEVLTSFFGEPEPDSEGVMHFPEFTESSEGTIQEIIQNIINNEYITEINEAATYEVTSSSEDIVDDGEKLTRAGDIKAYVDSMIHDQSFDVVVADTLPTASADTFHKLYFLPASDSEATSPNQYMEYITIRQGAGTEQSPYTYYWELIGDTSMSLKGYAQESWVKSEIQKIEIAGVTVTLKQGQNGYEVSAADLKNALGLKALAYKDSASGTVPAQTFTGLKATGTLEATVTGATLSHTDTNAVITSSTTYTPAGSVSVSLTTATAGISAEGNYTPTGSVVAEAGSSTNVLATAAFAKDNAGVEIEGTNEASAVTFDNTGSTVTVVTGITGQAAPSFTEGTFTPASLGSGFYTAGSAASLTTTYTAPTLTTAIYSAAQDAVVASYQVPDEMLVFSTPTINTINGVSTFNAGTFTATFTPNSPTAIDTTKFSGGSKAADTFSAGSFGTLDTDSAIKTLGAATAAAQVFHGDKYKVNTTTETVLDSTASFTFSGNQATITVAGQYEKATGATGSFTASNSADIPATIQYKKAEMGNVSVTITNPELTVEDFTVTAKTVEVQ